MVNYYELETTFSFSQVHHQSDQNVKCIIIIMRIEAISFQIYIKILREIIENKFPFPPEFGRPKASIFHSRDVPGCPLAKSLISTDGDPGLLVESFAVINLRGVSTNKTNENSMTMHAAEPITQIS